MVTVSDAGYMIEDGNAIQPFQHELTEALAEERELSLGAMLLQRWPTALIVTLLTAAASLCAIWLVIKPKYQVTASIHVAPVERHILFSDPTKDVAVNYRQYVGTEAASILSPVVIETALNEPEVRNLPIVVGPIDPVLAVQKRVNVVQRQGTEWLDVTMSGQRPDQMVVVVNAMIDTYLRRRNVKQREWDEKILSSLRQEESELEAKLGINAKQLQHTAVAQGHSGADSSGAMLDTWMSELQKLLAEAKKTHAIAKANYDSRQAELDADAAENEPSDRATADFEAFVANHPELLQLREDVRDVELDNLDDQRMGRGPNHPDVQSRIHRIEALNARIDAKTDDLWAVYLASRKQQLRREINALGTDMRNAAVEVRVFEEELSRLGEMRSDVASQLFELEILRHERQSLETSLAQVRKEIWTVDVEQNRAARVTLASEARVPAAPNKDSRLKFSAIAFMGSLCFGLAAALVRSRLDTSFRDPEQVVERLGVRVLGSVQMLKRLPAQANEANTQMREQLAAPMRGISAALLASAGKPGRRELLITSPTPGSGKSSMALNLARTLAATERRVLLVDADNNRMGVTREVGLNNKPGLSDLLSDRATKDTVVYGTDLPDLMVLPCGPHDERFGEFLHSKSARGKMEAVFEEFDEIIIDSPPVLASSDTLLIATLVDEVVLILRAGRSTQDEASTARQALAGVGANVIGVILNAVDPRRSRYGYAYGYVPAADEHEEEA